MADPHVGSFLSGLIGGYAERKHEQRMLKEQRAAEERAYNRRLQDAMDMRLYEMAMSGNIKAAQALDQRSRLSDALALPETMSKKQRSASQGSDGPFGPGSAAPTFSPRIDLGMSESSRMSRPEDRPDPGKRMPKNYIPGSELWLRTETHYSDPENLTIDDARLVKDYRAMGADALTPEGRPIYDAMFAQYEREKDLLNRYREAQGLNRTATPPGMVSPGTYDPSGDVERAGELLQQGQSGTFQSAPETLAPRTTVSQQDFSNTIPQYDEQSTRANASPFEVQASSVQAERERLYREKQAEIDRATREKEAEISRKQTEAQWDAIDRMAQEGNISPSELLKYTESKQAFQRGESDKWYTPQFREKPDRERGERYRNQLGNSYARSIAFLNDDIAAVDAKIKAGEQALQDQLNRLGPGQNPVVLEERWKEVKRNLINEQVKLQENRASLAKKLSKLEGDEDLYASYTKNVPARVERQTADELLKTREATALSDLAQTYRTLATLPFEDKAWFGTRMEPVDKTQKEYVQNFLSSIGLDPNDLSQIQNRNLIVQKMQEAAKAIARTEVEGVRPGELPPEESTPPPPGAPEPTAQAHPEMSDQQFEKWATENPRAMTYADRQRLLQLFQTIR